MSNQIADIQRILSTEDEEFRRWLDEHHDCEARLGVFTAKNELSTEEELEEKTLKKRKLQLKDQMAARIRSYESSNAIA